MGIQLVLQLKLAFRSDGRAVKGDRGNAKLTPVAAAFCVAPSTCVHSDAKRFLVIFVCFLELMD